MPHVFRELAHVLAAFTTNCRDFDKAWRRQREGDKLSTRWVGEWRSSVNRHHGAIRCALREISPTKFDAFFHAKYSKVLRVCYSVELTARKRPKGISLLQGRMDLGRLAGGVYTYKGRLSPKHLVCEYACRYDKGTFDLRPKESGAR